uniref:Uncharacterized protein n=1 Tax=Chromera velia CCMP2878 TaxID=1169474 RepID=A0A0G4HXJ4_9ALVE|eukprot:Cvel_33139.t1-p1 / transcript=Cvel_33139.t1 / gene=Cvel_33139 / organism=Chromera_velia_CCMP2878 / gene_product=hypothetical protein / transcript_product=hypothetical protein / location=Cvel_scaffold5309:508-4908(+) / protein_length=1028 / sequence_SO=supercontig / SO=protein_coding / is_pseudo=false
MQAQRNPRPEIAGRGQREMGSTERTSDFALRLLILVVIVLLVATMMLSADDPQPEMVPEMDVTVLYANGAGAGSRHGGGPHFDKGRGSPFEWSSVFGKSRDAKTSPGRQTISIRSVWVRLARYIDRCEIWGWGRWASCPLPLLLPVCKSEEDEGEEQGEGTGEGEVAHELSVESLADLDLFSEEFFLDVRTSPPVQTLLDLETASDGSVSVSVVVVRSGVGADLPEVSGDEECAVSESGQSNESGGGLIRKRSKKEGLPERLPSDMISVTIFRRDLSDFFFPDTKTAAKFVHEFVETPSLEVRAGLEAAAWMHGWVAALGETPSFLRWMFLTIIQPQLSSTEILRVLVRIVTGLFFSEESEERTQGGWLASALAVLYCDWKGTFRSFGLNVPLDFLSAFETALAVSREPLGGSLWFHSFLSEFEERLLESRDGHDGGEGEVDGVAGEGSRRSGWRVELREKFRGRGASIKRLGRASGRDGFVILYSSFSPSAPSSDRFRFFVKDEKHEQEQEHEGEGGDEEARNCSSFREGKHRKKRWKMTDSLPVQRMNTTEKEGGLENQESAKDAKEEEEDKESDEAYRSREGESDVAQKRHTREEAEEEKAAAYEPRTTRKASHALDAAGAESVRMDDTVAGLYEEKGDGREEGGRVFSWAVGRDRLYVSRESSLRVFEVSESLEAFFLNFGEHSQKSNRTRPKVQTTENAPHSGATLQTPSRPLFFSKGPMAENSQALLETQTLGLVPFWVGPSGVPPDSAVASGGGEELMATVTAVTAVPSVETEFRYDLWGEHTKGSWGPVVRFYGSQWRVDRDLHNAPSVDHTQSADDHSAAILTEPKEGGPEETARGRDAFPGPVPGTSTVRQSPYRSRRPLGLPGILSRLVDSSLPLISEKAGLTERGLMIHRTPTVFRGFGGALVLHLRPDLMAVANKGGVSLDGLFLFDGLAKVERVAVQTRQEREREEEGGAFWDGEGGEGAGDSLGGVESEAETGDQGSAEVPLISAVSVRFVCEVLFLFFLCLPACLSVKEAKK